MNSEYGSTFAGAVSAAGCVGSSFAFDGATTAGGPQSSATGRHEGVGRKLEEGRETGVVVEAQFVGVTNRLVAWDGGA